MDSEASGLNVNPSQGVEALSRELQKLLRWDPSNSGRLISPESDRLEYKESFNWGNRAKYAKTLSAFANKEGGFIVFGVKNAPHDLVGVNTKRFRERDPSRVAEYLNSAFSPEIEWEVFEIKVGEFQLGVLAAKRASVRPVVCIKTDGKDLREADIYYRYRGRSDRIRYPELQRLLLERQERERAAWLRHLSQIARIGVENVGVFDLTKGELSGPGGRLLVDAEDLKKMQFIQEGQFTERRGDGMPTLRLVAEVQSVPPGSITSVKTVTRELSIGEKSLMCRFLRQVQPQAPTEYLKQACRESSKFMPVYYFARLEGFGLTALRTYVIRESVRRNGLKERIEGATIKPVGSLDSGTPTSNERQRIFGQLRRFDLDGLRQANRVRLFEALTHLEALEARGELLGFIADLIEEEFDNLKSNERSDCRRAVAHLDEVQNRSACAELDRSDSAS